MCGVIRWRRGWWLGLRNGVRADKRSFREIFLRDRCDMLGGRGFAVFVGRECGVGCFKILEWLAFQAFQAFHKIYAANRDY